MNVPPPPGESVSSEYFCTLYGYQGKRYRMKTPVVVIGRSLKPQSIQKADLGVGFFKNISRQHVILKFEKETRKIVVEPFDDKKIFKVNKKKYRPTNGNPKRGVVLENNDTVYFGSSFVTVSIDYSVLKDLSFVIPPMGTEGEKTSWKYALPDRLHRPGLPWEGLDRYHLEGRKWMGHDDVDVSKPIPRFRSTVICGLINDQNDRSESATNRTKNRIDKWFKTFKPCDYKHDINFGFDEYYVPHKMGVYFDIRTFLCWVVLKSMTWNIRPGEPYLDPRIEYGCRIEELEESEGEEEIHSGTNNNSKQYTAKELHLEEIDKFDVVYLAMRFFLIKDLTCLTTIENCRKFCNEFFKAKDLKTWRKAGRPIKRDILEYIFKGINVINPHRSLMNYLMAYRGWKVEHEKAILCCAKDRQEKLDKMLKEYNIE